MQEKQSGALSLPPSLHWAPQQCPICSHYPAQAPWNCFSKLRAPMEESDHPKGLPCLPYCELRRCLGLGQAGVTWRSRGTNDSPPIPHEHHPASCPPGHDLWPRGSPACYPPAAAQTHPPLQASLGSTWLTGSLSFSANISSSDQSSLQLRAWEPIKS